MLFREVTPSDYSSKTFHQLMDSMNEAKMEVKRKVMNPHTRSLNSTPNSPSGRNRSTTIISRNANVFLNAMEMYPRPRLPRPKDQPATIAPGRLLRPPEWQLQNL